MNKKGILAHNVLMTFIKILLLIIVIVAIVGLIRSFFVIEVNAFDAEVEIFTQSVLYSKALMFYDDELGRLYPAMIDLNKFKADDAVDRLGESIYYKNNRKVAARITLEDFEEDYIDSLYFNEEWYIKWKAIPDWVPGPGGVKSKEKKVFVLIKDGDQLKKGYLEFGIIIPNK